MRSKAHQSELCQLLSVVRDPQIPVVSFDIFGTLLRRAVMRPEHIFWMVEAEIIRRKLPIPQAVRFGEARLHAGGIVQQDAERGARDHFSLKEIYDVLGEMLGIPRSEIHSVIRIELDAEEEALEANPLGAMLYQEAARSNKRIVLSSSHYLPYQFVDRMLRKNGFSAHESLFVSSRNYLRLPRRLGVAPSEIVHLGASSDIAASEFRYSGVAAWDTPSSLALAQFDGASSASGRKASLGSVATARFLHRRADDAVDGKALSAADPLEFLGFTFFGPLLHAIATWLADKLEGGLIDRLWFEDREGAGVAKILTLLRPKLRDRVDCIAIPAGNSDSAGDKENWASYLRTKVQGAKHIGVYEIGWNCDLRLAVESRLANDGLVFSGFPVGLSGGAAGHVATKTEAFAFAHNFPPEIYEDVAPNRWLFKLIFCDDGADAKDLKEWPDGARQKLRDRASLLLAAATRFVEDFQQTGGALARGLGQRRYAVWLIQEMAARPTRYDASIIWECARGLDSRDKTANPAWGMFRQ